jgi:hypothetical protein
MAELLAAAPFHFPGDIFARAAPPTAAAAAAAAAATTTAAPPPAPDALDKPVGARTPTYGYLLRNRINIGGFPEAVQPEPFGETRLSRGSRSFSLEEDSLSSVAPPIDARGVCGRGEELPGLVHVTVNSAISVMTGRKGDHSSGDESRSVGRSVGRSGGKIGGAGGASLS